MQHDTRPWGSFDLHGHGPGWALKTLVIEPGQQTSLQKHERREEYWMLVEGDADAIHNERRFTMRPFEVVHIERGDVHRLIGGKIPAVIVEVWRGDADENDIIRMQDDYGRTK